MKIDELLAQTRRDAERARQLEDRAASGAPPADEEEVFLRKILEGGQDDRIVKALGDEARKAEPAAKEGGGGVVPLPSRSRRVMFRAAAATATIALAATVLLFFGPPGARQRELPRYALSTQGTDAPTRGMTTIDGGALSEGARVTVVATPEEASRVRVAAKAFARCSGGEWFAAGGSLTVAESGAVLFAAPRDDVFGAMRGACDIAIVLAPEGEALLPPDGGAKNVLTATFLVP